MRTIALCLLSFAIAASAAPPPEAPELEKLRASYKAAIAKGTKSILQSHITTLEKLRDIYTRGSNLAGAAKVQADIDRANVTMATGEFLPPAADANNAAAPELDKLRARNDAEIERALKPYRETYLRELDRVRDNFTRAANLAAATAVQDEIDAMKPVRAPRKGAEVGDESFFVDRTWITTGKSVYHFDKGGAGVVTINDFKTSFTWKKLKSGIIEVSRPIAAGAPVTSAYFKFDNAEKAWKSDTLGGAAYPIHIEK